MVYYDGVWYGDWSVFSCEAFIKDPTLHARWQPLERNKAKC